MKSVAIARVVRRMSGVIQFLTSDETPWHTYDAKQSFTPPYASEKYYEMCTVLQHTCAITRMLSKARGYGYCIVGVLRGAQTRIFMPACAQIVTLGDNTSCNAIFYVMYHMTLYTVSS